ncbi:MAG: hypothetical protein AVDCRST_MAG56-5859 [uncultured Cytophagales bacterium]|uniref:Uncharacterized protein n=1 Tax=uncultured Cytophagales bacterium TaxID=158755 RepID=A0A6J4KHU8_9SPHI|nr:MAG: hypothetical protein AVDCRST_MAG56-5859 [uncultured Cytophagales bacterium]
MGCWRFSCTFAFCQGIKTIASTEYLYPPGGPMRFVGEEWVCRKVKLRPGYPIL